MVQGTVKTCVALTHDSYGGTCLVNNNSSALWIFNNRLCVDLLAVRSVQARAAVAAVDAPAAAAAAARRLRVRRSLRRLLLRLAAT